MCSAVFFFTLIDSSAKWLALIGFVPLQVTFVRYLGHFLTSLAFFLPKEGATIFVSERPQLQFLRAIILMVGTFFNFLALNYLPLNVTIAIFFASPLVVTILSIPILHEKVQVRQILAVLFGFGGVLIIIQPDEIGFRYEMIYSLIALLCASMYFILTRMVAGKDRNSTSQIYSSLVPTLFLLPFIFDNWIWPDNWRDFLIMGLMGLAATLGHSFTTIAHRLAKASSLAPVIYVQLVFMTVLSWFIFGDLPTSTIALGTLIIIFSGLYVFRLENTFTKES